MNEKFLHVSVRRFRKPRVTVNYENRRHRLCGATHMKRPFGVLPFNIGNK
jgi:hypothetical protein